MGPLRFASRSTLKGPGIFDRSGQRSLWHFGAMPASAGRPAQLEALRTLFLAIPGNSRGIEPP